MNDRTTGASVSASGSRASVTDAGDRASGSRMRVRGTSAPARGTIFLSANGPRVRGERISRRVIDMSGSGNARHCDVRAFSGERSTRHGGGATRRIGGMRCSVEEPSFAKTGAASRGP